MKLRTHWLGCALVALSCGSGQSSTGVGNPGVISFNLISDDQEDDSPTAGAMDGSAGANAASGGSAGTGSSEAPGGATGEPPVDETPLAKAQIHHALMSFSSLRFIPCDGTLPHEEVKQTFVVDLVENITVPPVPKIKNVEGGYCGVDAPLAPAKQANIAGRSLFFDGERADGTRFLLFANMTGTLRLRAKDGAVWSALGTPRLLWGFRPRRWLTASEVDSADSELFDNARVIVIDVDRHPILYALIRARLAGKSRLYPDLNDNGKIDPDERSLLLGEGLENTD